MKKSRFLALVLVASLSLVGAGYAYWTDALFVNSTVNTGNFEVGFVDATHRFKDQAVDAATNYTNLDESILTDDPNVAKITITNLYPGKEVIYSLTIKNSGSIPAVFDDATIDWGETSADLKKVLTGKFGDNLGNYGFSPMTKLEDDINNHLNNVRIEPGATKVIAGSFYLPKEVVNSDNAELQTLYCNVTLNWTQHNNPAVN
jgi:hypothetical protein